jgi:cobalt-zinc-cadmium efflux system outer membrane protein
MSRLRQSEVPGGRYAIRMKRAIHTSGLSLILVAWVGMGRVAAQSPMETQGPSVSSGPQGIIGGPPGPSPGRTQPRYAVPPAMEFGPTQSQDLTLPAPLPGLSVPAIPPDQAGLPPGVSLGPDIGKRTGLTLSRAVELLLERNVELRVQASEMAQADADLQTAGLRPNPIVYGDARSVPYGTFTPDTAGGPTQYEVNVVHPFDVSGKRKARMRSAGLSTNAVRAKYADAVRRQVANLYTAYVDALAAQSNVELAKISGLRIDLGSLAPVDEASEVFEAALLTLATLLDVPLSDLQQCGLYGRLAYSPSEEPSLDQDNLIGRALVNRPDLAAQRINVRRAEADIRLTLANRFDDVQVLYQPFTNNYGPPLGQRSSLTWTLGVTVPMPIYNRQQGNIRKAQLILEQEKTRLGGMEHGVAADVRAALLEHRMAEKALARSRKELREGGRYSYSVKAEGDETKDSFKKRAGDVLERLKDEALVDQIRKNGEAITRHRKSMLRVNTAVGECVMP